MKNLALVNLCKQREPTGLLYLASWFNAFSFNAKAHIVDINSKGSLLSKLMHYDVIGLSAMTMYYEDACSLARALKKEGYKGEIILGGTHITMLPASRRNCFDAICVGQGEAWLTYRFTGITYANPDLETYPDLDWNLLDPMYFKPRFIRFWNGAVVDATLLTSRGCPFKCRFCATTQFWKTYQAHPIDWCIRQIENLAAKGTTHLALFDDLFTGNLDRLQRFANAFVVKGLDKQIKAIAIQARAETLTQEKLDCLKALNVKWIGFGLESGSPKVIQFLKRAKASPELNRAAVRLCKKNDIKSGGSFMVGNPTETMLDIFKTAKHMLQLYFDGADDVIVFTATPYPGTEFWSMAKLRGLVSNDMNFNDLTIKEGLIKDAMLREISRWQFLLGWYACQLALIPFKIRKYFNILLSLRKNTWSELKTAFSFYFKHTV